jgi:serine/threonine protein kinase
MGASTSRDAAPPPVPRQPPSRIRWRRGDQVGVGAVSSVFEAYLEDFGVVAAAKQVALSRGSESALLIESILQEAEILSRLPAHLNVVRFIGCQVDVAQEPGCLSTAPAGSEGDTLTIFMELAAGGSVASIIRRVGTLSEAVVRNYTRQMLHGLEFLHSNGILHRDVKGANTLLMNEDRIALSDFDTAVDIPAELVDGLAARTGATAPTAVNASAASQPCCSCLLSSNANMLRDVAPQAFQSGRLPLKRLGVKEKRLVGTPVFMAPEVINQKLSSPASDIWSLGCAVIEMLSGKLPWGAQSRCWQLRALRSLSRPVTSALPLPAFAQESLRIRSQRFGTYPSRRASPVFQTAFLRTVPVFCVRA